MLCSLRLSLDPGLDGDSLFLLDLVSELGQPPHGRHAVLTIWMGIKGTETLRKAIWSKNNITPGPDSGRQSFERVVAAHQMSGFLSRLQLHDLLISFV